MPRDIITTVYAYDELSTEAQEKARDWFREATAGDTYYAEHVYTEAREVGAMLGIEIDHSDKVGTRIFWSGFSSQGDGASFEGTYRYKPGAVEAVKAYAPQDSYLHGIARDLDAAAKEYPRLVRGKLSVKISQSGRYSHSHTMNFEMSEDGYSITPKLADALRSFADWIYAQLEAAYEWDTSDESIADTLHANDYTFTEDGKRFVVKS